MGYPGRLQAELPVVLAQLVFHIHAGMFVTTVVVGSNFMQHHMLVWIHIHGLDAKVYSQVLSNFSESARLYGTPTGRLWKYTLQYKEERVINSSESFTLCNFSN